MKEPKFLSLTTIKQHEALMRKLNVSEVARSPSGFLAAYKRANGDPTRLSESWHARRKAFIARTLPAYHKNPTLRRKLSLIAWAYMP